MSRSRVWGGNGLPCNGSLDQLDARGLRPGARQKPVRDDDCALFSLELPAGGVR
ncbi:MAG TPA: hypothetical protein VLF19_12170 [Methylomirabilota bacterium]|nr:hypothetical protein [Methylomirabilota bacterium]